MSGMQKKAFQGSTGTEISPFSKDFALSELWDLLHAQKNNDTPKEREQAQNPMDTCKNQEVLIVVTVLLVLKTRDEDRSVMFWFKSFIASYLMNWF